MKINSHRKAVIAGLVVLIALSVQCYHNAAAPAGNKVITYGEREAVMLRTCFPQGKYVNAAAGCEAFLKIIKGEADQAEAEFQVKEKP